MKYGDQLNIGESCDQRHVATPDSERAQDGLDPIARTLGLLDELLGRERERAWLNTPHLRLGNETPLAALLSGRAEEVARMLGVARDGGVLS